MSISDRFVVARKKLGLNQIDLAQKLGVSSSAITNYERGVNDIPASLVIKLRTQYDISLSWLLLGEGAMFEKDSGQLVEDASFAVLDVLQSEELDASADKIAKLIRHFFEEMADGKLAETEEQLRRTILVI